MEVLNFNARLYMTLGKFAQTTAMMRQLAIGKGEWPDPIQMETIRTQVLPAMRNDCQAAGFELAVKQIDKIHASAIEEAPDLMAELTTRISEYLEDRTVFIIPPQQRKRYDDPQSGWESTIERFPAVDNHVEEANRCFALGRNTACVYHLMAIIQEALEALSRRLSVSLNPYTDTWNGLLVKIDAAIKAKQASTPKARRKAIEAFYAELYSDLRAIKNAWRNPTMHFRRTYTDEQAEKIYLRVQDFMAHAATRLTGKKKV